MCLYSRSLKTSLSTDEKRRNVSSPCSHETSINFLWVLRSSCCSFLTGKTIFCIKYVFSYFYVFSLAFMVFFNFNFVFYFFGDGKMKRAYFDPLRILKLEKKNVLIISEVICIINSCFVIMSRLWLTQEQGRNFSKFSSPNFNTIQLPNSKVSGKELRRESLRVSRVTVVCTTV